MEVGMIKKAFEMMIFAIIFLWGITNPTPEASEYPDRPITAINPVSPGGSNDILGRAFAAVAEKYLGQPVVVVNKAGGAGWLGYLAILQAPPDGYTLVVGATGRIPFIEWEKANGRKPPFTRQDLVTIGSFDLSPALLIVPYNSPWNSLADLIKDCKAKPHHYAFCSGGLYGATHIPIEMLMRETGITARHVPFIGGGPCLTSLAGSHADFASQFPSTSIPLIAGKKLKALAVHDVQRLKFLPEVPTVKELGIDAVWHQAVGIWVHNKTPLPIVQKLRDVLKKVVEDKTFIKTVESLGDEVRPKYGEELDRYWDAESERVARLYRQMLMEEGKEQKK